MKSAIIIIATILLMACAEKMVKGDPKATMPTHEPIVITTTLYIDDDWEMN